MRISPTIHGFLVLNQMFPQLVTENIATVTDLARAAERALAAHLEAESVEAMRRVDNMVREVKGAPASVVKVVKHLGRHPLGLLRANVKKL
jgi:predicted urease superfamily metal-dependent hydrolase